MDSCRVPLLSLRILFKHSDPATRILLISMRMSSITLDQFEMPFAVMPQLFLDVAMQAQDHRFSLRHVLPKGVSASLRLPTGRTVYVTVRDLSRTGACIIRRGDVEIHAEDEVMLEVSDSEGQQKLSLPASVKWVDESGYSTVVGLAFSQGPLLPGSLLDRYLDQSLALRLRA
jgi:hypothetical protein